VLRTVVVSACKEVMRMGKLLKFVGICTALYIAGYWTRQLVS
jgi:hypothetical protein